MVHKSMMSWISFPIIDTYLAFIVMVVYVVPVVLSIGMLTPVFTYFLHQTETASSWLTATFYLFVHLIKQVPETELAPPIRHVMQIKFVSWSILGRFYKNQPE